MARWYADKKGYRRFSDSGKLVHRWSAEKKLGRPLRETEVVHHGYYGKKCNDSDNLWVFKNQSEHIKKEHTKKTC